MFYTFNKNIILSLFCIFLSLFAAAQSYHIGGIGDEYMRILQLQGKIDPNISFTSRPNFATNQIPQDSLYKMIDSSYHSLGYYKSSFASFKPLLLNVNSQYNSMHPYGWNDAGMIKAKGIQTLTRWGIYSNIGPLSVQYMPEYVNAENAPYDISQDYGTNPTKRYEQRYLGQSSIRLNIKSISFGWSTENLWWGPGQYSAALLSNNAPGFPHFTFNTTRPIKTSIGSFEWQIITGRLYQDTSMPFEILNLQKTGVWYNSKIYNGINLTFQPKIFKGLFFGVNRSFQYTETNESRIGQTFSQKFLPVFTSIFKSSLGSTQEDAIPRDQAISLFTRWLFPKTHTEFYLEYGWNDHSENFRDFWIDPNHAAIYLLGIKHLVPLEKKKWLEINSEITQTAQSADYITRDAGDWYIYENGGYTNHNQILGAGSGKGNNVQNLSLQLINGFSKLGFLIQRIQHQPITSSRHYDIETLGLRNYRWVDVSVGFNYQKKVQNLIVNSRVEFVNSGNYAWTKNSHFNLFAQLNLTYLW